ncbi:MAG TPA: glycosyl hydrolase family 65 protein [Acholeplasma sp.]
MVKKAQNYLETHPWSIVEKGFHEERSQVSESLFSIANEYMGIRAFFDEGYEGKSLIGTYFNGVYEVPKELKQNHYKGISNKIHYMVNATNFFYVRIKLDEKLYLFDPKHIKNFFRSLDFKTGLYTRSYQIDDLVEIKIERIVDMLNYPIAHQRITIKPLKFKGDVQLSLGLDLDVKHWGKPGFWTVLNHQDRSILGLTTTNQQLYTEYHLNVNRTFESTYSFENRLNLETISFNLEHEVIIERNIVNLVDKKASTSLDQFRDQAKVFLESASFNHTLESNKQFFDAFWYKNDIQIDGDLINQQGIRFCLFQLIQTYQGLESNNNIGAKGLTGEAYSGHAFWDSETYCLPYYLFSNPKAAYHLLMFRYNTLNQARLRAKELDCFGAAYPIATLNGDEACDLWQHASLQLQPTSAVGYAIWHYVKVTHDTDFLIHYGFEMLVEIGRFLSSRGQYNQTRTKFGYYGVMGPDEFQMMVNHNAYTNFMGKKIMSYLIDVYETYKDHPFVAQKIKDLSFTQAEIDDMKEKVSKMYLPYDEKTKLFEQHEGFHDLPHIDIHSIPLSDFPLYSNWSYDRIYRNDMIKQPDVLMFMFLYNQSFDLETKKVNYEYYEPKTIHESSLSPSIHSILANELGKEEEALNFFGFATRMDLDDYNRNTNEGLHTTSISAAWVNIVYGFGGLRSDGKYLKLAPTLPKLWKSYTFNLLYLGTHIKVKVEKDKTILHLDANLEEPILIYNQLLKLTKGEHIIAHV